MDSDGSDKKTLEELVQKAIELFGQDDTPAAETHIPENKKNGMGELLVTYFPQQERLIFPGVTDQGQELLQPMPEQSKFLQKLEEKREKEKRK